MSFPKDAKKLLLSAIYVALDLSVKLFNYYKVSNGITFS